MTDDMPDAHAEAANELLRQVDAQQNAIPEQRTALALIALTHAVLALREQPPAKNVRRSGFWGSVDTFLLLAAVVAVVWLVKR